MAATAFMDEDKPIKPTRFVTTHPSPLDNFPSRSAPLWQHSTIRVAVAGAGIVFGLLGFLGSSLTFTRKSGMFLAMMASSVTALVYQLSQVKISDVLEVALPEEIKVILYEATLVDVVKKVYKVAFVDSAEPFERFVKEMAPLALATTDDERRDAFSNLGSKWRKRLLTPGLARALLPPDIQRQILPPHVPLVAHDIHDEPAKLDRQVELAMILVERRANEALGKSARTLLFLGRISQMMNKAASRLFRSSWEEIHVIFFMSVLILFFSRMIWRFVWHILGQYVFVLFA